VCVGGKDEIFLKYFSLTIHTHTYTNAHTLTRTHTHTHTQLHTHTCIQTQTHEHAHTLMQHFESLCMCGWKTRINCLLWFQAKIVITYHIDKPANRFWNHKTFLSRKKWVLKLNWFVENFKSSYVIMFFVNDTWLDFIILV